MSFFWLRTLIMSFSGVIGLGALWVLSTELLRPPLGYFPVDAKEAMQFDAAATAAAKAARIGDIRGDVWAAAAVAEAAPLLFAPAGDQPSGAVQAKIQSAEY